MTARRHDHHRHVRRRALGRGRRARGPRLLRDRQPAARAHREGRRARARGTRTRSSSRSWSTCARASSSTTSTAALAELRADGREHAGAVPRRGRRRARPPVRGDAAASTRSRPTTACPTASPPSARCSRSSRAEPTSSSTPSTSTCTSCATGCASCSATSRRAGCAADEHRVVRLQARAPARRRPRVRLPLPAQPALGRRAAPARRAPIRTVRDYVMEQPETERVPRRARAAVRAAAPRVRARGQGVPVDRRSAAPAAGTAASCIADRARATCSSALGVSPRVHHRDLDRG